MKTRTTKHENPITSSSLLNLVSEFHRTTRKKKTKKKRENYLFIIIFTKTDTGSFLPILLNNNQNNNKNLGASPARYKEKKKENIYIPPFTAILCHNNFRWGLRHRKE